MDQWILPKLLIMGDRNVSAERIVNMDTRQNVCRSICGIECTDHIDKYILSGKSIRAQQLSIWVQCGYDQKNGHSRKKEKAESVKFVRITEEKVSDRHCDKGEPEHVRDDKIFDKRNLVIERGVDHMKFRRHVLLQVKEPRQIDQPVEEYPRMLIFF